MNKLTTLLLAALMACLAACSDKETAGVVEGMPATLTLSIGVPDPATAQITRASSEQETSVEQVALFFYKASQPASTPVVATVDLSSITPVKTTETNYVYTATVGVDSLYSGEWYLYAVANYGKNFSHATLDELRRLTKAEMDAYCTTGGTDLDISETAILMSGRYQGEDAATGKLTLQPGNNNVLSGQNGGSALILRRLLSKVTFTFTTRSSDVSFTPLSYDLYNVSNSSSLMERNGWEGINGSNPGTLDYMGGANGLFNRTGIAVDDNDSIIFYMQENAQQCTTPNMTYNMREERVSDTDRTFKYAPANATYIVVRGLYSGPLSTTDDTPVVGEVSYTVHLGDFSKDNGSPYDNFTVRRNCKYNYKIKVNGVNSIVVEAQQQDLSGGYQHGAEGNVVDATENTMRLDAHYDQVIMRFLKSDIVGAANYKIHIRTPYDDADYTPEQLQNAKDKDWISFAKPKTKNTFNAYSDIYSSRVGIYQLLQELQENDLTHAVEDGDSIYIAAYVNEFYYDDKKDSASLAHYVNADDREMLMTTNIKYSRDGKSTYTVKPVFCILQASIKSFYSMGVDNPFGVECAEETAAAHLNSGRSEPSSTANSQGNGWENTTSVITFGSSKWADYVDEEHNGWINGYRDPSKIMKSGYNYTLYQWLSRNRDLDGDGIIDEDEIRWYVPAHDQCLCLWYGNNSMPREARVKTTGEYLYHTSTNGISRTWWIAEGVAFGYYKTSDNSGKGYLTHCVRNLKDVTGETSDIATYDASTRTVTMIGLSESCVRSTHMTGNYPVHKVGEGSDRLPRKLQIAQSNCSSTVAASTIATSTGSFFSYSETGVDDDSWRVPNEKELGIMLWASKLEDSNITLTAKTAARSTYLGSRYYYVQTPGGSSPEYFISTSTEVGASTSMYIRPVRDAQ